MVIHLFEICGFDVFFLETESEVLYRWVFFKITPNFEVAAVCSMAANNHACTYTHLYIYNRKMITYTVYSPLYILDMHVVLKPVIYIYRLKVLECMCFSKTYSDFAKRIKLQLYRNLVNTIQLMAPVCTKNKED